jgi:calcineurin-like phosphoesterase
MQILFIGDIVGRPGRRAVRELLPGLVKRARRRSRHCQCRERAAGFGITRDTVDEHAGMWHPHLFTTGNHVWDKKEAQGFIDD